jgi:secreted trypsin-like serine protease
MTAGAASAAGDSDSAGTRIVGGYYPSASYAPWVTFIQNGTSFCTSSLIGPDRVLTAAHCVDKKPDPSGWTARVGVRNRSNPSEGQTFGVRAIVMHPSYENPTTGPNADLNVYDLAILFLSQPSSVAPGPIGTSSTWDTYGTAFGWGHYNLDHSHPLFDANLRAVNLALGSDSICNQYLNTEAPQIYFSSIHICAYDPEGDDCITHGDSGGPLTVGGYIIGVTNSIPGRSSWGPCAGASMALFSWVAAPQLREWALTVQPPAPPAAAPTPTVNTACNGALAALAAARGKLKKAKNAMLSAVTASERRRARRKLKKARRRAAALRKQADAAC